MNPKALVTGGAGFVGRHVVKRLLNNNYDVTVVDNFYPGSGCLTLDNWPDHLKPATNQKLTIIKSDARDYFKKDLKTKNLWNEVVHLAAIVGGRLVIENQPLAVGVDLSIDAEFFNWLAELNYKPEYIHYFSSSAAYPIVNQTVDDHQLLSEDLISFDSGYIGVADLTYGWSKLTGEFLAKIAHEKYGHNILCYRPFSGYGEDQDISYPFPAILRRCLNKEDPVIVWGSGQQMRDFIYIEDCIDGMFILSRKCSDGSAINLSTGKAISFNDLANMMARACNYAPLIKNTASKPEGVFARYGSVVLQNSLGFYAKTSLEEGIKICANYISKKL